MVLHPATEYYIKNTPRPGFRGSTLPSGCHGQLACPCPPLALADQPNTVRNKFALLCAGGVILECASHAARGKSGSVAPALQRAKPESWARDRKISRTVLGPAASGTRHATLDRISHTTLKIACATFSMKSSASRTSTALIGQRCPGFVGSMSASCATLLRRSTIALS